MKNYSIFVLVAMAIVGCNDASRDLKQFGDKPYVPPAEHKEFFDDFNSLLKRYPKAAQRFKLADTGEQPAARHVIIWKCKDVPGFGVDCKPEVLE